ncbi:MAG: N-acetyltransferase [bacterium]
MVTKIFNDKKIKIRELSEYSVKDTKRFLDFINSFIKEDAQLLWKEKFSLKGERAWLKDELKEVKNKQKVYLVAEENNIIVGSTEVGAGAGRADHIGTLHIAIRSGYRGMGLGKYLMDSVIKLAKRKLKVKIIKIPVFSTNKPAIGLYKNRGFKKVARVPKQFQYKGKMVDEIILLKYL